MIRPTLIVTLALCAGAVLPFRGVSAQVAPGMPQEHQAMMKAMQDAQAAAAKPGDEDLSCAQLEEQFGATMSDPQLHSTIQAAGEQAQRDVEAVEAAKGEAAAQTTGAIASSIVPGAGMPIMMAGAAANQAKVAQGAMHMQQQMLSAQQITASLPTMMRGQRLVELATAKQCEWAAGILPPGVMDTDPKPESGQ